MAQPPRRSRRLQGLPPELPGLSSTDGNTDRSSLPVSNVETSLVILHPGERNHQKTIVETQKPLI